MADLKQRLGPLDGIEMPDRWSEIRQRAPRAGFDPEPPRRPPLAVIALAAVLSVGTLGWLTSAFDREPRVAGPIEWITTEASDLGISLEHPADWNVNRVDEQVGFARHHGVALTNVPFELVHPDLRPGRSTTRWDMEVLPSDGAVVWVGLLDRWFTYTDAPPTALPLSMEELQPITWRRSEGVVGSWTPLRLGGRMLNVQVWLGDQATVADRDAVERVLASIRPVAAPTDTDTRSPEPDPEPTLDPDAVDVGLGFGICDAGSLTGAFGTGESTRVWFGTRTNEETLRCVRSSRRFVLAVDVGGDRTAEAWMDPIGPHLCFTDCGLTGVLDLDGDGTDELVLLLEGGVTPTFGVVDVRANGEAALMGYVDGDAPQGLPGDGPAKLTIGGDEAYSYAVSCTEDASGPLITQQAVAGVVDAPELGARVATYSMRLTPEGFLVVSDDVQEGVDPPPDLSLRGSLCGLELPSPLGR